MDEQGQSTSGSVTERPLASVVLPCLNEEEALGDCIDKIKRTFAAAGINGEIVVCDNGSTDNSVAIAKSKNVVLVHQPLKGYGNAYLKGFACASGRYLIMGDADDTYDFELIPNFLEKLTKENYEFVTGSRYAEGGDRNITFLHRYVGNPALTLILNILFGTRYTDVYCGFRAFSQEAYHRIQPVSPGMEFNLELAINAHLAGLRIAEIPIQLAPRKGESKLNTFRDGWRSLRMMLIYSPNRVFFVPGFFLFFLGLIIHIGVLCHLLVFAGRASSGVTSMVATTMEVIGFQIISLGLHAKTYSWSRRFDKSNATVSRFYSLFNLETGLLAGAAMTLIGLAISLYIVYHWLNNNLLPLESPEWVPVAASLIIIGVNIIFSSLFISAMAMEKKES